MSRCDIAVIGGGIAGASVAAEMSRFGSVTLIEAESGSGYHATGRSAASVGRVYGNAVIRALTDQSVRFLEAPPVGFSDVALVRPRPWLFIAGPDHGPRLDGLLAEHPALRRLDAEVVRAISPVLATGVWIGGALDVGAMDVDVDALLQGYLKQLRLAGGTTLYDAPVTALARGSDGVWVIDCAAATVRARVVVNAAGAWADAVAGLAGLAGLGLTPLRRTAILVEPPEGVDVAALPLTMDVAETFYFKPEAGLIMVSPADETPSPACDARPEEYDVALAAHLFETATDIPVRRVRRSWAGLRTFAPDRSPVVGFDPRAEGFFWLAGQGGYGVQTAPAMARLAAGLLRGEPQSGQAALIAQLSPARFLAPAGGQQAPHAGSASNV